MRRRSFLLAGPALLGFPEPAHADPPVYSSKEIRGTVVDDASGEPLEGVIVVAQWELVREVIPGMVHRSYGDRLEIAEVVSGRDGGYVIPGWGPVPRPAFLHLEHRDPIIAFFKPDYYPRSVANEVRTTYSRDSVRESQWDGKTVRLRKFTGQPQEFVLQDGRFRTDVKVTGTLQEYASKVGSLQEILHWQMPSDDWKKYPRLIVALKRERERLAAAGLNPNDQIDRTASLHGGARAVDQFLKANDK